jgi:tripartite ATP-independent transporter DctP family solute receptor
MSSALPATSASAHWIWYDRFSKSLASKVGDKVQVDYFPDSQLGKEADVINQVKLGVVDMMISDSSVWATMAPEIGVLDLGYLFPSMEATGPILDGRAGSLLNEAFTTRAGVEILGWSYSLGGRNVCARHPATTPEEMKGLKIRVPPVANLVATLRAMGAAATSLAVDEVYAALQTGVIDGMEHDAPTILSMKLGEIVKDIALTRHLFIPQPIVISRRAIRKIPTDLIGPFREAAAEATEFQRSRAPDIEASAFATLESNGVTLHECDRSRFKRLVTPVWDAFAKTCPAAKPILDAITAQV